MGILSRYEIAFWPGSVSPWCALLPPSALALLEYGDDLKFYYKDGYGYNVTWQMTQPLMADLLRRMTTLDAATPASLYFGHSESTNTVLTALGLYRDERPPLAADWPEVGYKYYSLAGF